VVQNPAPILLLRDPLIPSRLPAFAGNYPQFWHNDVEVKNMHSLGNATPNCVPSPAVSAQHKAPETRWLDDCFRRRAANSIAFEQPADLLTRHRRSSAG